MKLMGKDANQVHRTLSNYQFSAVGMDGLDGSEYTVVQLLVDASSSVYEYKDALEDAIRQVLESCKQSPRSENLLFRVAAFSSDYKDSISELHGFTPLGSLDPGQYAGGIQPTGCTPLYDAALSALESLDSYGGGMADQNFLVNGIQFVITDGFENASRCRKADKIAKTLKRMRKEEKLESVQTILIGIDDQSVTRELQDFKKKAAFDDYISLGSVSAGKLAQLARFVSMSISAASMALGTGAMSRRIGFVS